MLSYQEKQRQLEKIDKAITALQKQPYPSSLAPELGPDCSHWNIDPSKAHGYKMVDGKDYAVYTEEIKKNIIDQRSYRSYKLENGLEVLCVSDPKTADSAACITTPVVAYETFSGTAHLFEHLSLSGSKKYPSVTSFHEFISKNGGMRNATTDETKNQFFFSITNDAFANALDRLASAIKEPFFDEKSVESECHAVETEFQRSRNNDAWRFNTLKRALANQDSPFSNFYPGNWNTLNEIPKKQGKTPLDIIKEFHEEYFSANLMKVVLMGNDSLDNLFSLAYQNFADMPNKFVPPPVFEQPIYKPEQLRKLVKVQTNGKSEYLRITFNTPDTSLYLAEKTNDILANIFGHEGVGSILSILKEKGYATTLGAGSCPGDRGRNYGHFGVLVNLTSKGYDNYIEVIEIVFAYIQIVLKEPLESICEEIAELLKINSQYRAKKDPIYEVSVLSQTMILPIKRKWTLSGHLEVQGIDTDLMKSYVRGFNPENALIFLSSPKELPRDEVQTEPIYGTQYTIADFPEDLSEACVNPRVFEGLALPQPNEYIPENFEIITELPLSSLGSAPSLLRSTNNMNLWFKKDNHWNLPNANVKILLRSNDIIDSPDGTLKADIASEFIEQSIVEELYPATMAGYHFHINNSVHGISIHISGFNDKLFVTLKKILQGFKNIEIDNVSKFENAKEKVKNYLQRNLNAEDAAVEHLNHLLTHCHWTSAQKLAFIDEITQNDVISHIAKIYHSLFIETLIYGNFLEADAKAIGSEIERTFPISSSLKVVPAMPRPLLQKKGALVKNYMVGLDNNSAVNSFFYVINNDGVTDSHLQCKLQLFSRIIGQETYNVLRVKEHLGYCAKNYVKTIGNISGLVTLLEGPRPVGFNLRRIDVFLKDSLSEYLKEMSVDKFKNIRDSLVADYTKDIESTREEFTIIWDRIQNGDCEFDRRAKYADIMSKIEKGDMMEFHKKFISPSSNETTRVTVQLQSGIFSKTAFEPILSIFEQYNSKTPEKLIELIESSPTLSHVREVLEQECQEFAKDDPVYKEILEEINALFEKDSSTSADIREAAI